MGHVRSGRFAVAVTSFECSFDDLRGHHRQLLRQRVVHRRVACGQHFNGRQNLPFVFAAGTFGMSQGAEFFGSPTTCKVSQCSIALPSASIL